MTPKLRAALFRCQVNGGTIAGYPDRRSGDDYLLTLRNRREEDYCAFTLAWKDYLKAVRYWQRIDKQTWYVARRRRAA